MINSIIFLEQKLKELFLQFPKSNIRYEFRSNRNLHLVEITPLSFYLNEKYKIAETKIEDEFEFLYPNESILFISENSLNKISSPNFELISEFKGAFCFLAEKSNVLDYNFTYLSPEYAGDNNYALAA